MRLEDRGVGEVIAVELEIDVGDTEGIDVGNVRWWSAVGLFFWRGWVGRVGVASMDGIEGVPYGFPAGADAAVERLDGEVRNHDISRLDTAFADDAGVGFGGEVTDDENPAVVGGGHFFFQLEPAVFELPDFCVHEAEVFFRLEQGVAVADDEMVGKPEADVVKVWADIGGSNFKADAVPGAGLQGAEEASLPVLAREPVAVGREHVDVMVPVFEFAAVAGAGGEEPAGGAAGSLVFCADIDGVEVAIGDDVLGSCLECQEANKDQGQAAQGHEFYIISLY